MMRKKGMEKTIELLFVVFVLVIVSSVVLMVFFKTFRQNIFKPKCNPSFQISQAKQDCMQACSLITDFGEASTNDMVEYCSKTEKIDNNCNNIYKGEIIDYGQILACEDRVPCFLLYKCRDLDGEKCKDILLKYAPHKFNKIAYTNISGDCNLPNNTINWVKKYDYVIR